MSTLWLDKPYYSLNAYFRHTYGQKCYKIAVDAGLSCPNRDGTIGYGGCSFCAAGSGTFAVSAAAWAQPKVGRIDAADSYSEAPLNNSLNSHCKTGSNSDSNSRFKSTPHTAGAADSVTAQIADGLARVRKSTGDGFVIYFQAYTNTYASPTYLREIFSAALSHPSVIGISIATRPDCLPPEILTLLSRLKADFAPKFIWIELGLQTIHESTACQIRRGYPLSVYEKAMQSLRNLNIPVITHVILGLPGETPSDMLETISYLNGTTTCPKPFGVKLQLLHVLRGTTLADDYAAGKFTVFSQEEYLNLLIACIRRLNPEIVLHRVTGDGPKSLLVAPLWSSDKKQVLNTLHRKLRETGARQGDLWTD